MVQLNGATTGTITQAHLAVVNHNTATVLTSYGNWMGGYTANHYNGWLLTGTTKNNVLSPASYSTLLSCSGMYTCNNGNRNNGAISLALYINGTTNGTTKISNAYFYAIRIA